MNIYLCPVFDDAGIYIRKFVCNNREQCEDKIKAIYTEDFDVFCQELCDNYEIIIGDIYEIDEFM